MCLFLKGIARSVVFLACVFVTSVANALHVDTSIVGDKAYFLFSAPNKIAVYNMATQSQSADISLTKIPTAFAVTGNTAYIAFNRELRALDLTTGNSQFVRNTSNEITRITLLGNYIYAMENNGSIHVINRDNFVLVETELSSYWRGSSQVASPVNQAIFTRSSGISPSDISKMSIATDGTISSSVDSVYHGDYPDASRLFLNHSESRVYDNAGVVYFAADLTYAGSLAGSLDDLAFSGDNPIVLRNTQLTLFNASHIEQGVINLNAKPDRIAVHDERVFTFTLSASSVTVNSVDISGFDLPAPGEPVNPNGLAYNPEFMLADGQDVLYLIDRETLSIFRWSLAEQQYLSSLSLLVPPTWVTYSAAQQRLYLGFPNGKISYFDTAAETPKETHFVNLPTAVRGLQAAGDYLFAADSSGAWATHYSFSADGSLLNSFDWAYIGNQYLWNPTTSRIYMHRDDTSPNDLVWRELDQATGLLGDDGESPYHGGTIISRYPLVASSDGEYLLNGGGQILSAYNGTVLNALSNSINAGIWINDQLITVDSGNNLQFWEENFSLKSNFALGNVLSAKLFNLNNHLVIVKQTQTNPVISTYDIANLPDSDADGVHDLQDNCINVANSDQADFDADTLGDLCDEDDDNDGLPDTVETALGLNPRDASDADGDLDGDGFSNRLEHLLGSDARDANSVPVALDFYQEDFENGWPVGFYGLSGKLPWTVKAGGADGSGFALQSTAFNQTTQSSEVAFTGLFNSGVLSFKFKNNSSTNYSYTYRLEVLVDGVLQHNSYGVNQAWTLINIALTKGVHTITFRVITSYLWGNEEAVTFSIDDLVFDQDSDNDGYANYIDNCPNHYNRWQTDSDNDGLGDECDNDPYNLDTDGDGYGDVRDNCPAISNPDQADLDNDGIGDVCDPTDNRPTDTDGDGIYDYMDNCPEIANPNQANMDNDSMGDVCDDDIDGDGIKGVDEAKYSFLSDTNPADAALDQDGDGVSNAIEIRSGYRPEVADVHPQIDLFDYYLLGDLDYSFVNIYSNRYTTRIRKSATANQFTMTSSGGSHRSTLERRNDGIYLISASYPYDTTTNVVYNYTDWLLVPQKMKLGQSIVVNPILQINYPSVQGVETINFTRRISLIEIGTRSWKGKTYDSVTLEIKEFIDTDYESTDEITYLKNLGYAGDGYETLESAALTNIDKPAPPANTGGGNNSGGGGGGGGSSNTWLLLMLLTLATYAGRRTTR
ncbi:thrombospondin type 3 repeat-containing protein [Cellvibrio mixtus]|uniref:thrombospondin type 3 repeat-containing protein n=1 Tax=Cellvibrio mixtus TaxID=39650 RepID=UPI001BAFD2E0|nr:thrombospondin type 3 repeat-containing protein [Cellvibrio mixtus]